MKKVFPLQVPGKVDARVVESVKSDVRKYVKRERRKDVPEGFTAWNFICKVGADAATATACELPDISRRIDAVANEGGKHVYVEVLAQPAHRTGAEPATDIEPEAK